MTSARVNISDFKPQTDHNDTTSTNHSHELHNLTLMDTLPTLTRNPEDLHKLRHICDNINAAILLLAMPIILIGNIMVVSSVIRFRRLRTVMNLFVASLSMADTLVGIPTIPIYAMFYINPEKFQDLKYLCLFRYIAVLASLSGSIISLTVVTFDRYVAVIYPLHYQSFMTKRRAKYILAGIWLYGTVISSLPLAVNIWEPGMECEFFSILPKPFTIFSVPIVMAVSLTLSLAMYTRIFYEIKQTKKRIKVYQRTIVIRSSKKVIKDGRMAKIMGFVFLLFVIFWLPFQLTSVLKYIPTTRDYFQIAKSFGLTLAMLNSTVNPFIYCWLRHEFRTAFKLQCCGCLQAMKRQLSDLDTSKDSHTSLDGKQNAATSKF